MIAIEVFRKKKMMEPVLNKCWPLITNDMPYPPAAEQEPVQKLIYFGLMTYAIVYESALAATMSSSAGHYLARMQLGKCKLGAEVTEKVESTFSGFDSDEEQVYADVFHSRVGQVIEMIMADSGDITPLLRELAGYFRPVADVGVDG